MPHGSVFGMSVDPQTFWKHGIDIDPGVNEPRISFAFRKLMNDEPVMNRSHLYTLLANSPTTEPQSELLSHINESYF